MLIITTVFWALTIWLIYSIIKRVIKKSDAEAIVVIVWIGIPALFTAFIAVFTTLITIGWVTPRN